MNPVCAKNRSTGVACILMLPWPVFQGMGGQTGFSFIPSSDSKENKQNKSPKNLQSHPGGFRAEKVPVAVDGHVQPPWVPGTILRKGFYSVWGRSRSLSLE